MARPRKTEIQEPVQEVQEIQEVPEQQVTATIEESNSTEGPVTVQGKKIQPVEHLATKKAGVYLKNKQTGKIISGPISEKVAKEQLRMWPNQIEISEDGK